MFRNYKPKVSKNRFFKPKLNCLESRIVPTTSAVLTSSQVFAVGSGAGALPQINVYSADTGALVYSFMAYDQSFTGGVRVVVTDLDYDGIQEIVTFPGAGGGPNVKTFNSANGTQISGPLGSFMAFDSGFSGGVFGAAGDINGDGYQDIIAGAGAGGGPNVRVFSGHDGSVLANFFGFNSSFSGGVTVAAGEMNGDGHADIVVGAGSGGGPQVSVFSGFNQSLIQSFFAYDVGFRGGIYVAVGNVIGVDTIGIITGAGAGGGPQVNVFNASASLLGSFYAFDKSFTGGVNVGVSLSGTPGLLDILSGAGAGGGPEVKTTEVSSANGGYTFTTSDSMFAFNENFTEGVWVGGGKSVTGLPGVVPVIPVEVEAMKKYAADPSNNFTNYFPAIGAPEHTDAIHSGLIPVGTFTGSFTGPNQVLEFIGSHQFSSIQFIVNDGPNASYLLGGGLNTPTDLSNGQYVAKFNPTTGEKYWQTYLNNLAPAGQWQAFGGIAIIADGSIITSAGTTVVKIDRSTGAIIKSVVIGASATLPNPLDANFDGITVAPDSRGTILLKTQNRAVGSTTQGNAAMFQAPGTNSTIIALDPATLETLDSVLLNQMVPTRTIVTEHNGTIYLYMAGQTNLVRVILNPTNGKFTVDTTWAPSYLLTGQSAGDAPAIIGDWIIPNQNAGGSNTVPITIVAINQNDPTNIVRYAPWGLTLPTPTGTSAPSLSNPPTTWSQSVSSFGVDSVNNMIYAQDTYQGVVGVRLDPVTGIMTPVWNRPDWRTTDYFSLIGPADKRVLISQNLSPSITGSNSTLWTALTGTNYTENVIWANAATGATIAESGYNPSTAQGSLPNVGYGGRIYMMRNNGFPIIYLPLPA